MSYQALDLNSSEEFVDILIAEMAELGFSTFEEKDENKGFIAYTDEGLKVPETKIQMVLDKYGISESVSFSLSSVEKENWNADWEKNYDPIIIADKVLVRASFHEPKPELPYEIIVTPKMSFGTGHHETTHQLVEMMLSLDMKNKQVLDAGCGTGILGIFAAILGAEKVAAYDIDEWAVENSIENFGLNSIEQSQFKVWQGDASTISSDTYDIILANINRNILLEDLVHFQQHIRSGSYLLLSGFYEADIQDLLTEAGKYSLKEESRSLRNKWAALCLQKSE
jgi:ribosomal protein L11 methyltransferase